MPDLEKMCVQFPFPTSKATITRFQFGKPCEGGLEDRNLTNRGPSHTCKAVIARFHFKKLYKGG